ncbi:MAG: hypothetical protein AAGF89_05190, partial [Bacteroidota bacterium]
SSSLNITTEVIIPTAYASILGGRNDSLRNRRATAPGCQGFGPNAWQAKKISEISNLFLFPLSNSQFYPFTHYA